MEEKSGSPTLQVVPPPSHIFKKAGYQVEPAKQVMTEMPILLFDHMEYPESGGMLAWFKDCPFPAKGLPFPQAIHACNGAKRFFKRGMDVITSKEMRLPMIALLFSRKKVTILEKLLSAYTDSAKMLLDPFSLNPKMFTECALEIRIFIINFLSELGVNDRITAEFAEVFSTLIQYDDAYRIRIEDGASETTKERLLENPAQEIKRVILIMKGREPGGSLEEGNIAKFNKILKVLRFLFLVPKFRRAFRDALEKSKFENFQLDDSDRYHSMLRGDYNIMGYSVKDRVDFYKVFHQTFPPFPPRTVVKLKE